MDGSPWQVDEAGQPVEAVNKYITNVLKQPAKD